MATEQALFDLNPMPDYPKYQAYLQTVHDKFTNPMQGQRAGVIVHHGVITRRMMRLHGVVSDFTPGMIDFTINGLGGMVMTLIQFAMLERYQNELFNAMEEAYKIFREEEEQYGAQQLALQQFEPAPNQRPN